MSERRAQTLNFREGLHMARAVLEEGQLGLVRQIDNPEQSMFFRWPTALSKALRLSECVYVVADPADIKPLMIDQHDNLQKSARDFRIIRQFLGNALVPNIGGDAWYERRKLLMPSFSHAKVHEFSQIIEQETDKTLVDKAGGDEFPLKDEMTHLTLRVINQFLFSEQIDERTQREMSYHITGLAEYTSTRIQNLGYPPQWLPNKVNKQFTRSITGMHKIINEIIDRRTQSPDSTHNDMLSVLMCSKDEETGLPLSRTEIVDESLSMLIAGHETTANTLTWAMYLLAKHPEIQDQLRNQIKVDANGKVDPDSLRKAPLVGWVLKETMRLYPPVWVFSRKNKESFTLPQGQEIPEKTLIAIVPWLIHRNPGYWTDPDKFNPERFNPISPDRGVKENAFLPFGMGARRCLGADLAMTEASIVLAKTVLNTQIEISEDVQPALMITTRPNTPVMTVLKHLK